MSEAAEWLCQLPNELDPQRRLVERLVAWCEQDEDARWLVVGCSFARGRADQLSDLDLAMGLQDERYEEALGRVRQTMADVGNLVQYFDHELGLCVPHRRIFAQYRDRTQIDLVVCHASNSIIAREVVLYHPAALVRAPDDDVSAPSPEEVDVPHMLRMALCRS